MGTASLAEQLTEAERRTGRYMLEVLEGAEFPPKGMDTGTFAQFMRLALSSGISEDEYVEMAHACRGAVRRWIDASTVPNCHVQRELIECVRVRLRELYAPAAAEAA